MIVVFIGNENWIISTFEIHYAVETHNLRHITFDGIQFDKQIIESGLLSCIF
jgi:hypothetical protein